jgi:hypothetical protein
MIAPAGIAKEATMTDAISHQAPEMNTAPRSKVRVWDPLVRVFHGDWSRPSRPHG